MKSLIRWFASALLLAIAFQTPAQESPRAKKPSEQPTPQTQTEEPSTRGRGPRNRPAPPKLGEPINDKAIFRYLQIEGEKLVRAGRTLTNWDGSLDRKTCRLKLSKPGQKVLSGPELAERVERATVIVGTFYFCDKCSNLHMGSASGFLISESGAMATSRHVLGGAKEKGRGIVALTRDGRLCAVREVLAADPLNDLVVLQLEGTRFDPLPLVADAPVGASITVMSHPENHYFMLTTGVISRYSAMRGKAGVVNFMAVTADFAKGSSGGPVVNEFGAAVGMVNNTQSIYYDEDHGAQENLQMVIKDCVPARLLLELIKPE